MTRQVSGRRLIQAIRRPAPGTVARGAIGIKEDLQHDCDPPGGRWESARSKMLALDFATQAQQMKAIGGQPDYAPGSVHAPRGPSCPGLSRCGESPRSGDDLLPASFTAN